MAQDRIARTQVGEVRSPREPSVAYKPSGAAPAREVIGSGMDTLSNSFTNFFQGLERTASTMSNAELIGELGKIEGENKDLAEQAQADALAGRPEDADKASRRAYRDTYRTNLGVALFQSHDAQAIQDRLETWMPEDGDPRAWVKAHIDDKAKGMDPIVESSFRATAAKFTEPHLLALANKQQLDALGESVKLTLQNVSATLSRNESVTPEMYDAWVLQVGNSLPVGQRNKARDVINGVLFEKAKEGTHPYLDQFFDMTQANGKTLRQMYTTQMDDIAHAQVENAGRVRSVQALTNLQDIGIGINLWHSTGGQEGMSPSEAIKALVEHKDLYGRSNSWASHLNEAVRLYGGEASYELFKANVNGRLAGNPNASIPSAEDLNKYGDRMAKELFASDAAAGVPQEATYGKLGAVFSAVGHVPQTFANALSVRLNSENTNDRVIAFKQASALKAAMRSNEPLFNKTLGEQGVATFTVMDVLTQSGQYSPEAAAAEAKKINMSGVKDPERFPLGDNQTKTIDAYKSSATTAFRRSINPEFLGGLQRTLGISPSIDVSQSLVATAEKRMRLYAAVLDQTGLAGNKDLVVKMAVDSLSGDTEAILREGRVVLRERTTQRTTTDEAGVVPVTRFGAQDLVKAAESFGRVAEKFGGKGSNLDTLEPRQDGRGLDVWVTDKDGRRVPAMVMAGQTVEASAIPATPNFGGEADHIATEAEKVQYTVPDVIPTSGWTPPGMEGSGYMFVKSGQGRWEQDADGNRVWRDFYQMVYRGETVAQEQLRLAAEQQERLASNIGHQEMVDKATLPPASFKESMRETIAGSAVDKIRGEERAMFTLRYHLERGMKRVTDRLVAGGVLDPRTFYQAPVPPINTESDARAYLERLMSEARMSTRYTKVDGSADQVYENQRLNLMSRVEGIRTTAYDDATGKSVKIGEATKGHPTIGIGFNMDRTDARKVFSGVLGIDDFDAYYTGKKALTQPQVAALFNHTVEEAERIVDNKLGDASNKLDRHQRLALVSMAFNSPKLLSTELVNAIRLGRMDEAATLIRAASNHQPVLKGRREQESILFRGALPNG